MKGVAVHDAIKKMLEQYGELKSALAKEHALKEIIQCISLFGLSEADFFKVASFYGGTALRLCHGLDRFSEDLDFCLTVEDDKFQFKTYFPKMKEILKAYGFDADIALKDKSVVTPVESAFIKQDTYAGYVSVGMVGFKSQPGQKLKIKIEIDTDNPPGATYELKSIMSPIRFNIKVLDLPSLFAGKLHAIIAREYKGRVKGRDFYDWLFYYDKNIPFNLVYLREKLINSGHISSDVNVDLDTIKNFLTQKIKSVNFKQAMQDIRPFIHQRKDPRDIEKLFDKGHFLELISDLNYERLP